MQQGEGPLQMPLAPQDVQGRLRNYFGSVTFGVDGSRFAVSSPRRGLVTLWSAEGDYLRLPQPGDEQRKRYPPGP